jgi:hypothetical protein
VTLEPIEVDADSIDAARGEAFQALAESPDLLVIAEDRDRARELYEQAPTEGKP